MRINTASSAAHDDELRRARSKGRLYVLCQTVGWLFFLTFHLVTLQLLTLKNAPAEQRLREAAMSVMIVTLGWAITHFSRRFFARWGWKELGWRALLPRILAAASVQSLLWSAIGYGYLYVVLGLPWTMKFPWYTSFAISWANGVFMLTGWLCLYFFHHLFDRFNRSEIERLRLSANVKEAELRALKSQVNPHFIFNSLNSLRALIDEDPVRARQAVTQLANLLRYSLQSGQFETVPFEDELRIVNDYLALEQVRHDERLRLRLDVAPDTLHLPVPPMLLQTLVENAVKYGISTRIEGGEITITARRENGALRLQVTNPGELAAPATAARSSSTGVGLNNAAERLRLLFGERASLHLRAETPVCVVAEAVIPLPLNA